MVFSYDTQTPRDCDKRVAFILILRAHERGLQAGMPIKDSGASSGVRSFIDVTRRLGFRGLIHIYIYIYIYVYVCICMYIYIYI